MENKNQASDRDRIADRLKEARMLAGLSQDSAAKILKLQRPAISEIESGRRKVSAEEIIQFADLYRVSKSWLLLEDEDQETTMNEQLKIAAREWSKMKEDDKKKLLEILKIFPTK